MDDFVKLKESILNLLLRAHLTYVLSIGFREDQGKIAKVAVTTVDPVLNRYLFELRKAE